MSSSLTKSNIFNLLKSLDSSNISNTNTNTNTSDISFQFTPNFRQNINNNHNQNNNNKKIKKRKKKEPTTDAEDLHVWHFHHSSNNPNGGNYYIRYEWEGYCKSNNVSYDRKNEKIVKLNECPNWNSKANCVIGYIRKGWKFTGNMYMVKITENNKILDKHLWKCDEDICNLFGDINSDINSEDGDVATGDEDEDEDELMNDNDNDNNKNHQLINLDANLSNISLSKNSMFVFLFFFYFFLYTFFFFIHFFFVYIFF